MSELPKRPGISEPTLQAAGVRFVDTPEAGSIEIPYLSIDGKPTGFKRWRLPKTRSNGQKYDQEVGSGICAYIPPGFSALPPGGDLVLVEGEFKCLSLVDAGVKAIGLPSFGTYTRTETGVKLLAGIPEAIACTKPERLLFLGDSDTATNAEFSRSAVNLASLSGLPVALPRIPLNGPGKGVDDCREFLGQGFGAFWRELVMSAEPVDPKSDHEPLAVRLLLREESAILAAKGVDQETHHRRLVAMAAGFKNAMQCDLLTAFAERLGFTKKAFREQVDAERQAKREKALSKLPKMFLPVNGAWKEVEQEFGPPLVGDEGRYAVNEAFWAGLYAKENTILHCPDEKSFYRYESESGLWKEKTGDTIIHEIGQRMLSVSRGSDELAQLESKRTHRSLSAVAARLRGICEVRNPFHTRQNFIHCANVVLEFDESADPVEPVGSLFAPEHYSRNALPIRFNHEATCPRFLNELLLPAVTEDDASLLQRWFGSAILQHNLAQRFVILDGDAGKGKTQLAVVAQLLVGAVNCGQLRTKHLLDRFELYRLAKKTLLIGADVPGDFLTEEGACALKALVGGDPLEAERKGSNASFTLNGQFNVLITCNERLRIRLEGDVGAWRRRLLIVRFEAPPPAKKIPNFGQHLVETEGEGILFWAIQGAIQLLSEIRETGDYVLTPDQASRVDSLLAESESLDRFVAECVVVDASEDLPKSELVEAYYTFCTARKWKPFPRHMVECRLPDLMLRNFSVSQSRSLVETFEGKDRYIQGYRGVTLKMEL